MLGTGKNWSSCCFEAKAAARAISFNLPCLAGVPLYVSLVAGLCANAPLWCRTGNTYVSFAMNLCTNASLRCRAGASLCLACGNIPCKCFSGAPPARSGTLCQGVVAWALRIPPKRNPSKTPAKNVAAYLNKTLGQLGVSETRPLSGPLRLNI